MHREYHLLGINPSDSTYNYILLFRYELSEMTLTLYLDTVYSQQLLIFPTLPNTTKSSDHVTLLLFNIEDVTRPDLTMRYFQLRKSDTSHQHIPHNLQLLRHTPGHFGLLTILRTQKQ